MGFAPKIQWGKPRESSILSSDTPIINYSMWYPIRAYIKGGNLKWPIPYLDLKDELN